MKKLKNLSTFCAVVGLVTSLAACGTSSASSSGDSSKSTAAKSSGPVTLNVWSRDNVAALLQTPVKDFNASHKDVQVKLTSVPANSYPEQYATALSSGNAPDVATLDLVYAPYFASIGAFKDITSEYNKLSYKDKLVKGMTKLGNVDGKQYAIPLSADVSALIYNKDQFKAAGLDPEKPPTTWQELRQDAIKLTNKDHYGYVYAAGAPGTFMFTFLPYIWGNGGNITSDNGKKALIGSEKSIEALQLLTDMTQKDKVVPPGSPTYQGQQAFDAFTSGKASMIVYGSFKVAELNQKYPNVNYGVALIPKSDGGNYSSFAGGDVVTISAKADAAKQKAAWEFINYIESKNVQVDYFAKNGTMPVRTDFFDNEYFQKEPKYQIFTKALEVAKTPYSLKHNDILQVWNTTQQALMGQKSPKDVFTNEQTQIQKIIDSK